MRLATGIAAVAVASTLAACLPPASPTAAPPRPLKPEDGPKGSVYVDYYGGAFTRQIQTRFRVDRAAYVMVGHVGGDGEVRVLFPETPRSSGWVSGGKTITIKPYTAMYDMSPHLFSFATAPQRSFGAQMDSYDGFGHGYVFMIASRYPIDFYALMEAKTFEQLEIENYERAWDPRYAVRSFADDIVTGPYTLKFASSQRASSYARFGGCSSSSSGGLRSTYPYGDLSWLDLGYSYFSYPGASLMNAFAFASSYYGFGPFGSCRGSQYAAALPRFYETYVPVPATPTGPLTPRLQRPERRTLTDPQRTAIIGGKSSIDRTVTANRRTFDGSGWRNSASRAYDATGIRREFIDRPGHGATTSSGSGPQAFERGSRPVDTPRLTTPAPPPAPPPTTTSSSSSSGETRGERPHPKP